MKYSKPAVRFLMVALFLAVSLACYLSGSAPATTSIPTVATGVSTPSPTGTLAGVPATTASPGAPVILLLRNGGRGELGDIYTWNIASQSLKQLTSWGFNSAPQVSPDGKWLAYRSVSQAAITTTTQGRAIIADSLANIWLLNPYTEEAIRIADQPQAVTYPSGDLIHRQAPVWSPDGASVAWIEGDAHGERVAIYTLSSRSTITFPLTLPSGCGEGADPELYLGRSGIAITHCEGTPSDPEEVIYGFNAQGRQLAKIAPGGNFFIDMGWITAGNHHEYLGGDAKGVLTLVDPLGNPQLVTPQGYSEMYGPNAPDGLSVYPVSYPSQWALTRQGQKLADISNLRAASDISIAPDGQGIVYRQAVAGDDYGGKVFAYLANGQTVPVIIPQLNVLAVTWGATAWRIHN
jgi:hypothetical protein